MRSDVRASKPEPAEPRGATMAHTVQTTLPLGLPTKRPRHHLEEFSQSKIEREIEILVISLRSDDFVDIEPVPYPVKGLSAWR
jgi:hypothetical protein